MLEPVGIQGLCFDSAEGYEAMCISLIKGQPNITFRSDWKERITIGVEKDGVASIVLNDAQEKPHLRLEAGGTPWTVSSHPRRIPASFPQER